MHPILEFDIYWQGKSGKYRSFLNIYNTTNHLPKWTKLKHFRVIKNEIYLIGEEKLKFGIKENRFIRIPEKIYGFKSKKGISYLEWKSRNYGNWYSYIYLEKSKDGRWLPQDKDTFKRKRIWNRTNRILNKVIK